MGVGRVLTIISTALVMLIGATLIGAGIYLTTRSECVSYFKIPMLVVGSVVFAVALMGFVGSLMEVSCLVFTYLFFTFCAIITLAVFTVLAFLATNKPVQTVSGVGYKSYSIPQFSNWLQSYVNNPDKWQKLSSCIHDSGICTAQVTNFTSPAAIYKLDLSPIQSGCCLAPPACNISTLDPNVTSSDSIGTVILKAASSVLNSTTGQSLTDMFPFLAPPAPESNATADCPIFKPEPAVLCYQCSSCKAGFLKTLYDSWRTIAYINLTLLVILIVVYMLGCCALRSARYHEHAYKGFV